MDIAEPLLQVCLLARGYALADRNCRWEREEQDPRASCGYADAAVGRISERTGDPRDGCHRAASERQSESAIGKPVVVSPPAVAIGNNEAGGRPSIA